MNLELITAWTLRTILLLFWIPFTVLAEIVRLVTGLDTWSSNIILQHKSAAAGTTSPRLYVVRRSSAATGAPLTVR